MTKKHFYIASLIVLPLFGWFLYATKMDIYRSIGYPVFVFAFSYAVNYFVKWRDEDSKS